MSVLKNDMKIAKVFAHPRILATFAIELLDSETWQNAEKRRFLSRCCYFSNSSLKVYTSNGYIKLQAI